MLNQIKKNNVDNKLGSQLSDKINFPDKEILEALESHYGGVPVIETVPWTSKIAMVKQAGK